MNVTASLEIADAVIDDLHAIARDECPFEYKLPVNCEERLRQMRAAVLRRVREFLEKTRVDALKESL